MNARRHDPLRLSRATELTSQQRMMVLSLQRERRKPTIRLRYATLGWLLVLASSVGLLAGFSLR